MNDNAAALAQARRLVAAARRLTISTGAGVSAESGIPTFRDALTGLWANYDPQALATEEGFRADPSLVWDWYATRRERIAAAAPNAAHRAIARRQLAGGADVLLITQNVDGLHRRALEEAISASTSAPDAAAITHARESIVELHGNILRVRCLQGCGPPPPGWESDSRSPPRCERCGSPLRPDVVWFGELLPEHALARAHAAAGECDLMLVVGTSGQVYPAAQLPFIARERGVPVIAINPEPTPIDEVATVVLRGAAGAMLPPLLA